MGVRPQCPEPPISLVPPAAIGELQSQLQDTQSSLAGYANKFRILDSLISNHDNDGVAGFDRLPKDMVSQTLLHVHIWVLNCVYSTLHNIQPLWG